MAKILSKTGISNSSTIQAGHVTQSIDALTGASDYDITISGSLVITASANQFEPVLTAKGQINTFNISASGNISSSTIFASTNIRVLNNATIGGTLDVTGNSIIRNGLTITGSNFEVDRRDTKVRVIYRATGSNSIEQLFLREGFQTWVVGRDGNDGNFKISSADNNFANSSVRLSIDEPTGNVGIGTTSSLAKLHVNGVTRLDNTVYSNYTISDQNYRRLLKPVGGTYNTSAGIVSGAIKITYPVGYNNTMHHVKARVYEYSTNKSFTIHFGGYNYLPTPSWINCFAYIEGDAATDINHTVRFGYDGSKMVVYIGEISSEWSYPQIFIDEIGLGYNSSLSSTWSTESWSIGFETSAFANVTATISDTKAHVFARKGSNAYYNTGNVGIGTISPQRRLHISSPNGTAAQIQLGQASQRDYYIGIPASTTRFEIHDASATATRLSILEDGKVGIGTASPSALLEIFGTPVGNCALNAGGTSFNGINARLPGAIVVGAAGTAYPRISYNAIPSYLANTWAYAVNDNAWSINMGGGGKMSFDYVGAGVTGNFLPSWNTIMTLVSGSGNVGIGVAAPAARLAVLGEGTGKALIGDFGFAVDSNYTGISLNNSITTTTYNFLSAPNDDLYINRPSNRNIRFRVNNTDQVFISSSGNVGINTTSPSAKLDVDGSTIIRGALTASIISASSGITASSIFANNYRTATATLTAFGSFNIDASLTGSVTWIGSLIGGGPHNIITASMPQDGLSLDVYIRNTATSAATFILCGSTNSNGSSPFLVSGSNNTSAARTSISLTAFSGSAFIQFRRVGTTIVAGVC